MKFLKILILLFKICLSFQQCSYGHLGSNCDECGIVYFNPFFRIVGGEPSLPYSWPSIVYIVFTYKNLYEFSNKTYYHEITYTCGGTLIDRKTVLTSAHCYIKKVKILYQSNEYDFEVKPNQFNPTIESMYTIYLGLYDKNDFKSPTISSAIQSFILHPQFDPETNINDIAVIKLANEINLDYYIQIACLPNPAILNYPTSTNVSVWAVGWGTLSSGGPLPNTLQQVKLTLYDSSFCKNVYPDVKKDWNKQICAGEYSGGKDTCQGDSGGPLYYLDNVNGKKKFILIGITSFGEGCGKIGYPGIYTKINPYLSWIFKYTEKSKITTVRSTLTTSPCSYGYTGSRCDECSRSLVQPNLNNLEAIPNSWPWTAFLIFKYKYLFKAENRTYIGYKQFNCIGNLIDRRTILTTSSCLLESFIIRFKGKRYTITVKTNRYHPTLQSIYKIYLGLHSKNNLSTAYQAKIAEFIKNPLYNSRLKQNDIGIIKLKEEVVLNEKIQTVCLPTKNYFSISYSANDWIKGNNLQNFELYVQPNFDCQSLFGNQNWLSQMCIGDIGEKICPVNVGGAIFVQDKINGVNKYVLIGLLTENKSCKRNGDFFGVYTKVYSFINWIYSY